ncbi:hypothetical protein QFZ60_003112 [Arthrobacter sp. B2I5]|uniref:DUF6308 family protein n=1 Tax=Arthrobacter sp. B2I5 TaxID=3042266 RepID=UPI00278883B8|nr:DUF6308 family protein [Arthrobacter sp. B2I5]MDQ0826939.1 hypothetical protein [Arthrobacter sp. B2I5]
MSSKQSESGIVEAFAAISDQTALDYLREYYGLPAQDGRAYTGSHFDGLAAVSTNRITAEDIIAVACLSVHLPAPASVEVLGNKADDIAELLSEIPNVNLEDIPLKEHDIYFGEGSAAFRLWSLLRRQDGVGPTTASKLMARKRPGLIPIYDSVVARVTGFRNSAGTWRAWHDALSNDEALKDRLQQLRELVQLEGISLLRVLDVVLWMDGKGFEQPERIDEKVGV